MARGPFRGSGGTRAPKKGLGGSKKLIPDFFVLFIPKPSHNNNKIAFLNKIEMDDITQPTTVYYLKQIKYHDLVQYIDRIRITELFPSSRRL